MHVREHGEQRQHANDLKLHLFMRKLFRQSM
jgi:hypothetical protein